MSPECHEINMDEESSTTQAESETRDGNENLNEDPRDSNETEDDRTVEEGNSQKNLLCVDPTSQQRIFWESIDNI